jgi:hypothetical protein
MEFSQFLYGAELQACRRHDGGGKVFAADAVAATICEYEVIFFLLP